MYHFPQAKMFHLALRRGQQLLRQHVRSLLSPLCNACGLDLAQRGTLRPDVLIAEDAPEDQSPPAHGVEERRYAPPAAEADAARTVARTARACGAARPPAHACATLAACTTARSVLRDRPQPRGCERPSKV
ncbi:hypothetical protein GGX14DRAFT_406709 [Mycena pura]|uniref:Uncharacterized protein n=1 Tax=Mycena pura TaxID=153505 RepID=A0AAD6UTK6_9AGAR|nr:hypothetical protein GGX14DRAFT_406709 [Mycena pura]